MRFIPVATGDSLIGIDVDKEIGQLLSWYVNGTLTGAERDRVEAALRDDARAKALLEWEKSLREAVKSDPSLEIAEDRGLAQVMQRIRAEATQLLGAGKAGPDRPTVAKDFSSQARLSCRVFRSFSSALLAFISIARVGALRARRGTGELPCDGTLIEEPNPRIRRSRREPRQS